MGVGLSNGFISNYKIKKDIYPKLFAASADIALMLRTDNGKIFRTDARLSPFFSFGFRVDYLNNSENDIRLVSNNQYGVDMHLRIATQTRFQLQMAIDQKLQNDFNTHPRYRFGLVQELSKQNFNNSEDIMDSEEIVDYVPDTVVLYETFNDSLPDTAIVEEISFSDKELQDSIELADISEEAKVDTAVVKEDASESNSDPISRESDDLTSKELKKYYVILFSSTNLSSA